MPRSRSVSSLYLAGKCIGWGDSMMGKHPGAVAEAAQARRLEDPPSETQPRISR